MNYQEDVYTPQKKSVAGYGGGMVWEVRGLDQPADGLEIPQNLSFTMYVHAVLCVATPLPMPLGNWFDMFC